MSFKPLLFGKMTNQLDLFNSIVVSSDREIILNNDGEVLLYRHFFNRSESDNILNVLIVELEWKQEHIRMYGKSIPIPRLTAWYGDSDKPYSYSGIKMEPLAWHPVLLDIKSRIETVCDRSFNGVLLNYYRDGNDGMSWHADDERELGKNPVIGSVSFGGTRKFSFKHKHKTHPKNKKIVDIDLTHGSLLLMTGACQSFWLHRIAKTKKQVEPRVNLTFRFIE
jgi:alkylated DNA repair dioxygenase AlkB